MWYKISVLSFMIMLFANPPEKQNIYHKDFYTNGKLKSEGWILNGIKIDYWKFYHSNGNLSEQGHYKKGQREKYWYFYDQNSILTKEGHYLNGKMTDWWLFYDIKGNINHKCQLNMGVKNGYCLKYTDEVLTSAEKYKNGKKIKEWFNYVSFKSENKLSDLR